MDVSIVAALATIVWTCLIKAQNRPQSNSTTFKMMGREMSNSGHSPAGHTGHSPCCHPPSYSQLSVFKWQQTTSHSNFNLLQHLPFAPIAHLPTMAYPPNLTIEPFLFNGTISGHSITILLDSGATTNFISQSFLDKHPSLSHKFQTSFSLETITLADGTTLPCGKPIGPLRLQVNTYKDRLHFIPTQLHHYDVILGTPWLTTYNPCNWLDWRYPLPFSWWSTSWHRISRIYVSVFHRSPSCSFSYAIQEIS